MTTKVEYKSYGAMSKNKERLPLISQRIADLLEEFCNRNASSNLSGDLSIPGIDDDFNGILDLSY